MPRKPRMRRTRAVENLLSPGAMFVRRARLYIMGRAVAVPPVAYPLSMPAGLHHGGVGPSRPRVVMDGGAAFAPRAPLPRSGEGTQPVPGPALSRPGRHSGPWG